VSTQKSVQFFRIRNFERYQHYKDRRPPWIKLYRDLWRDPAFFELSEAQRYHIISLFVLASQNDNLLKLDQKWLRHELAISRDIDIQTLVDSGFIEFVLQDASNTLSASTVLADCNHLSIVETETDIQRQIYREEKEREAPPALFPIPLEKLGEFGWCVLTEDQKEKLVAKLNGNFENYVEKFDHWVNEAPNAKVGGIKRKDRHAYESILRWYERDRENGNGTQRGNGQSNAKASRSDLSRPYIPRQ
jgi:hypothetical protein